jgi:hypothetical protein
MQRSGRRHPPPPYLYFQNFADYFEAVENIRLLSQAIDDNSTNLSWNCGETFRGFPLQSMQVN